MSLPDLDPRFTAAFAVIFLLGIAIELVGVARKEAGDTVTEHWQYADQWLRTKSVAARWFFRVLTAGTLTWVIVHFLAGAD